MLLEGPYEVGVRYIRTETKGTEAMVFYPVDGGPNFQTELESFPQLNAPYIRNAEKGIRNL